jgi:peptide/nickel transport system substrate-binding protein
MSEDARVYTFHLRDDVKFYPSGNPMTADDVIWCFDRVLKGQFPLCKGYIYTKELRKIDDYTVQVELKSPFVAYLAVISGLSDGAIMDSKAIIPHVEGEWGTPECDYGYRWVDENSVGTGPYYRKEWKRGVRIVVERNPYYWGPKPTNDKITFQIVAEAATLQLMLERGDIDTTHTGMPLDIVMQYIENPKPGINVAEHPTFLCLVSHLNPGYAPLADPKVRQAMRAAINYPQIIEKMLRGKALPMSSPLYKEFLGGGKTYYEYDLEKAKKLISESKYPNGFEITKIVASTADPGIYFRDLALVEAGDLAKIGIKVKVEEYDWSVIGERFMDVKYEWGQDYCSLLFIDPEGMLTLIGAPRHGENCIINKKFPWRDEEIDALCDQALGETDIKKREQLYDQVCKLIAERGIEIWDCQMMGVYPYRSNVKNFEPSSWMDLTDYSNTVRT